MKARVGVTIVAAGLVAAFASAVAGGEPLSPAYRDQLQRCVAAIRPRAVDPAATAIRYTVTDASVRGVWRQFIVESAVLTRAGERIGGARSRCRVERWGPALLVRNLDDGADAPQPTAVADRG